MSKRGTIYALAVSALLLVVLLVFGRSCRMGNHPQSLDDTVIEREQLSPLEDTVETQQSGE